MGPDPAVAAVRLAVRRCRLEEAEAGRGGPVVVACSGGADSLALAAATVFEASRAAEPRRVVGATVDHGLQDGSDRQAQRVVDQLAALGVHETLTARVQVHASGQGPEAAAREARYAVLEEVAARTGASTVLLGHTLDDQAETVLLGLTRGSGGRSIAGMRRSFPPFQRPLLDVTRSQTEQACRAEGIDFWVDPHNADPRYTRSRLRSRVMPVLEDELGPGVAATLARTADQLREDMELLDRVADSAYAEALVAAERPGQEVALGVPSLAALEPPLRRRVIRTAALRAGSPSAELFRVHVLSVEELVTRWRGQQEIHLPGHRAARRTGDTLTFSAAPVAG